MKSFIHLLQLLHIEATNFSAYPRNVLTIITVKSLYVLFYNVVSEKFISFAFLENIIVKNQNGIFKKNSRKHIRAA